MVTGADMHLGFRVGVVVERESRRLSLHRSRLLKDVVGFIDHLSPSRPDGDSDKKCMQHKQLQMNATVGVHHHSWSQ